MVTFLSPKPLQVLVGWHRVGQQVPVLSFSLWVHHLTAALLQPAATWVLALAPLQVRKPLTELIEHELFVTGS